MRNMYWRGGRPQRDTHQLWLRTEYGMCTLGRRETAERISICLKYELNKEYVLGEERPQRGCSLVVLNKIWVREMDLGRRETRERIFIGFEWEIENAISTWGPNRWSSSGLNNNWIRNMCFWGWPLRPRFYRHLAGVRYICFYLHISMSFSKKKGGNIRKA